MSKPSDHIDWTDGDALKIQEPPTGKKELGWTNSEKPPFEWMNWLFYVIDQWLKYFETISDQVLATGSIYDAVVGVGGTHGSLAALMADTNIANYKNVLVIDPITLSAPVTLNQNDMTFEFTPKATIAKGTATQGLIINAQRVRIKNAHFINFGDTNDEAIAIEPTAQYVMVRDCYFTNCDITIKDESATSSISGNVEI